MPQAMNILDAEAAVDNDCKKLETIPTWQMERVKSKNEVILEAQRDKESPFCYIDGHVSSHKCGVGTKVTKIQRQRRAAS